MADHLARIVDQVLGHESVIRPHLAAKFAPGPPLEIEAPPDPFGDATWADLAGLEFATWSDFEEAPRAFREPNQAPLGANEGDNQQGCQTPEDVDSGSLAPTTVLSARPPALEHPPGASRGAPPAVRINEPSTDQQTPAEGVLGKQNVVESETAPDGAPETPGRAATQAPAASAFDGSRTPPSADETSAVLPPGNPCMTTRPPYRLHTIGRDSPSPPMEATGSPII